MIKDIKNVKHYYTYSGTRFLTYMNKVIYNYL